MKFRLLTPDKILFDGEVDMAVIPGSEGDFAVLDRHEAFMTAIIPGRIRLYKGDDVIETVFVQGGFAEVKPDGCDVVAFV